MIVTNKNKEDYEEYFDGTKDVNVGKDFRVPILVDTAIMNYPIVDMPVGDRVKNAMRRTGIFTIGDFVHWYNKERVIRNMGVTSWKEFWGAVFEVQLDFAPDPLAYAERVLKMNYPKHNRYTYMEDAV